MADITTTATSAEAQKLANAVAQASAAFMFGRDAATQSLGISIAKVAPGYAQLIMPVRPDMLNGYQTCHGGFIFSLADSAFAFACNSYNRNTVGSGCTIDYLAPGQAGDVLTATATEQARGGKTGLYDVTVSNQDGVRIALFRGKSYQVHGTVLPA